ncbi:MAG TPA: hypothetical protein DEP53_12965 [Bacteroidetes bacterium]|nr:hypothetical protein [Bacteroidota bacterium]
MRTFTKWIFLIVIASLVVALPLQAQGKSGKDKVDLMHNGHVISVAPEAVPAHLAHGDSYYNPAPIKYTVQLTFVIWGFDELGNLVILETRPYSQLVDADGEYTFTGVFTGFETVLLDPPSGTATVTRNGDDLIVSGVQSNVSVNASTVVFPVGGGLE